MKKTIKKMHLSRETLRHLVDSSLDRVAGGETFTCKLSCLDSGCPPTCDSTCC